MFFLFTSWLSGIKKPRCFQHRGFSLGVKNHRERWLFSFSLIRQSLSSPRKEGSRLFIQTQREVLILATLPFSMVIV